ncbi:hypothetical protein EST38_g6394 [Candolleomyces aberdarensis]|uniref:Uncharacterized protein n=1 Tax=Candolleomyces aberdarensis TaxID=2316362 RepID=A0A4V1Q3R1_9AGAR|nr:hypothetical protein EST38_g6394 [Candolleomyces aberdarensis]
MLFKLSSIVATALAAASLASASAINLEQRQAPAAACTFVANPSGTPDPSALLFSEWNFILGRNLADHVPPSTIIRNGNSTVTGPDNTGLYTIEQTIAADALTTAEAITVVTGWVGETFDGPWSGVAWTIQSVTC